jgi:glutamate/tyrosine decarboxylase-like PLP-dependent enzyme
MADSTDFELSSDDMRTLGYRVVDMIVDHHQALPGKSATSVARRDTLEKLLREPPPRDGRDPEEVLATVERDVLSNIMYCTHPRHFAWVPGPGNFISVLADTLASGVNVCPGTWFESSGPSQIELITTDWLIELCGLPETAGGVFVSGGSIANLTGLVAARQTKLGGDMRDAVIYSSDQAHSSNWKNIRILGFQPSQTRLIPVDADLKLDVAALAAAVEEDRRAGRRPFCVIATAGTTNTGTVDPLDAIADLCEREDLWMHVDGAYGAAAILTERGRELLRGMQRAHSLVLDPHKWLFQPFDIGCCLVRDVRWLEESFSEHPEYLQDTRDKMDMTHEVNFCDRGVQLTRAFRALKLWMSIKVYGLERFRLAIDRGFDNAARAQQLLEAHGSFEIATPAQLGVVTFRYRPRDGGEHDLDQLTRRIFDGIVADGHAMLTTTVIKGRTVLRLCTINPRTTDEDIRSTIDMIAGIGAECSVSGAQSSE